ncbi:hypothetical protein ABEB36_000491 [Hypothenemus hampei]|uniref:DDE Tnp4 domain-containing protein n=1 Tax=Hypothenemus hampei TaxID=57062 RepID=A0ABD1FEM3_HYPHA
MRAPSNSGSLYCNYKKTFSIILLAACDAEYRFILTDIDGYGSINDSGTLRESKFGHKLATNSLNIPRREEIPECTNNIEFPYFFVGDAVFPLSEHIIRSYPGILLSEEKDNFNKRLSRARRLIKNTFGVLAARWHILYQTIVTNVELVELITRTCVCLHNWLMHSRSYCPTSFVDGENEDNGQWRQEVPQPLQSIRLRAGNARHNLYYLRDELARYLNEEAKI